MGCSNSFLCDVSVYNYYNSLIDKLTDCENGLCSCLAEDAQRECQCDDQNNTVCIKEELTPPTGIMTFIVTLCNFDDCGIIYVVHINPSTASVKYSV